MQDILLWSMLADEAAGDDGATQHLRALLEELAALPINERWPYFGRLGAALLHPAADVRAAGLKVLAGAGGLLAYRAITRALHDPQRSVRQAAVAALGLSSASDTARWAHAAFHPLADVRRAALDHPPGRHLPWYAMLFLADETCHEVVRNLPIEKVPPGNVFAVLELTRRGLLTPDAAAEAIAEMPIEELYSLLSRAGPWRSEEGVAALLTAAGSDGRASAIVATLRADATADALEELLTLFWRSEAPPPLLPGSPPPARERFFARLVNWATDRLRRSAVDRVLCAVLMSAVRAGGAWDPLAAELALLLQPKFLEFRWIDRAVRRGAVDALYRYGTRLDPLPDAQIESLLRGSLCRNDDRLDLWVIGGILRWAGGEPYKLAERVLGVGQIVDSFLARPAESAPFFSIPKDPHGRSRILDVITARSRHSTGAIFAGLILVSNADELSFLDDLDGRDALGVYQSLLAMTTGSSVAKLSDNKVRRLAETLSPKLHPAHLEEALRATVDTPGAELDPLALRLLSTLARDAGAAQTVAAVRRLEPQRINRLLEILPGCAGFPYGVEILLAHSLKTHKDAGIRAWCAGRVSAPPAETAAARSGKSVVRLSDAVRNEISTCPTANLATAVEPCLKVPTVGLTAALGARMPPGMHSIATCLALLGCHDPLDEVAEQFAIFSADEPEFLKKLDAAAVKQWCWNERLPLLGNCWLHLWDPHCFAAGAVLVGWSGGVVGALRWALGLPSVVLCGQVFDTVARLLAMWRWRERSKLAELDLAELCPFLVDALPGDMGLPAARALATVHESRLATEVLDALQPRVSSMLADLTEAQRGVLQAWVDARGLAAAVVRRFTAPADPQVLRRIARSRDLDELQSFCRSQSNQEVQEATLRLIELGEVGLRRLVALLTASHPEQLPSLAVVIAESIPLWSESESLAAVRKWLLDATIGSELLLTVGLGFLERGDAAVASVLIALCSGPCEVPWFRQDHWNRLLALGVPERELALGLVTSPHPYAYQNALGVLLRLKDRDVDDRVIDAVVAFLEIDSRRRHELRVRAAEWLNGRGNHAGFPLLLLESMAAKPDARAAAAGAERDRVLVGLPIALVEQAVLAVLHGGPKIADESRLLELLDHAAVDATARDDAYVALVKDASLDRTRAHIVSHMRPGTSRAHKLNRLAHTFAWGVITGREITGRIFAVEMNAGEGLGHTRLETDKVWISPLPILRGEQHAEAVTCGLIVHEFGHHMYHRTPEALAVWDEAAKEGYHGLLNLVSDEHLERNLRALDEDFGDDLKKLAAYAFQHADKEVPLNALLVSLQARAFEVLSASDLRVARRRGCVLVNNGRLLAEMERAGMSFSRFVRALRMGLGKRGADDKVAAGLELFKGIQFRKSTMPDLKTLTLRLRDIFGWETVLMETFAQDALLSPDAAEVMASGEGITGDELREAVRRLLEDRTRGRGPRKDREGPPVKVLNVGPEESFSPITTVVPVPFDPAQHAAYAAQVAGPARQMRRYLAQLGLRMEPQRYRVQGKRVDRARIVPAGILRGDPRLLIARKIRIEADLFLGLIIDCSGSMQMSNHMQKAKLFGTMLAEAAKGLDGIDVRVFGFTDSVIYDAGDARHCAAHALEAEGGNNDAAALWHAALAARASRRRAKLLVMISDGSPTECTTNALKALVSRLSHRMNICCAQLAVCPLDVKCFPHYVELVEENVGDLVRRFGSVVQRLVQKAIRGR